MKNILALVFGVLSISVSATTVSDAKVVRLMLDLNYPNKVYIDLDKRQPDLLQCHQNITWEYVLDISTNHGSHVYSALLAAKVSGTKIQISGNGYCNLHHDIEDFRRLESW